MNVRSDASLLNGVARLGFGSGKLWRLDSRARVHLVRAAADLGVRHFDTAPLYGSGISEATLGEALRGDHNVKVATKVGLYPPGGSDQRFFAVVARKLAGKVIPGLSRPQVDFAVARARSSLDGSLRRLRRSHVDLLLLHEPDARLVATDEWMRWIDDERARVASFGLAGEPERLVPFLSDPGWRDALLQTRDSVSGREAEALAVADRSPDIIYGALADLRTPTEAQTRHTLLEMLDRWHHQVLLVGCRSEGHLRQLCGWADEHGRTSAGSPPASVKGA